MVPSRVSLNLRDHAEPLAQMASTPGFISSHLTQWLPRVRVPLDHHGCLPRIQFSSASAPTSSMPVARRRRQFSGLNAGALSSVSQLVLPPKAKGGEN
jgi:hypothetical protein